MTALTIALAEQLKETRWPAILPSIIDAAERDPEVAEVHAVLQAGFSAPFLAAAERARARGELRSDRTPADLVAVVLGPLYYGRWFSKEPIDRRFVDALVSNAAARALSSAGS